MRTPAGRITGHGDTPRGRYAAAEEAFDVALVELIGAGAAFAESRGEDRTAVAEGVRLMCHRVIDEAVDKAVLTYPEPTEIVPRTPTYFELQCAVQDNGAQRA